MTDIPSVPEPSGGRGLDLKFALPLIALAFGAGLVIGIKFAKPETQIVERVVEAPKVPCAPCAERAAQNGQAVAHEPEPAAAAE